MRLNLRNHNLFLARLAHATREHASKVGAARGEDCAVRRDPSIPDHECHVAELIVPNEGAQIGAKGAADRRVEQRG